MKNYELIETRRIEELSTDACIYRHKKSGARIFTMKNQDDNKVFSIAFRTPAEDSTGIAHITEHSVLCGSKKFPLKDPFVELAKGSLNTFLNAMTYPDKTVYPVASRNEKDFDNLMDVYLDAVFHPNSVKDPRILAQEGWHYELMNEEDALRYNGVVYNEMKGVFSSPESVLERYIMQALFPDTCYSNESGGDPAVIPELTFDKFQAFHARYYHPSNAYIILYGDMSMEKKLAWLDEAYLSEYDAIQPDSEIRLQPAFTKLHKEEISYSVGAQESLKKNTYLSWNVVVDALDNKRNLAMDILDYVLLSAPGAPLKQALIEAGIGEDIFGGFEDGIRQPYFSVNAKGADAKDQKRFLSVIETTLRRLVKEGLDQPSILAAINHDEFQYREADYGRSPKGLVYALTAMDTWLYDRKPWEYLFCMQCYQELREDAQHGYFEKLISELLLDNPHAALVICKPERGLTEKREQALAKKLADVKAGMSQVERNACIAETKALKQYQEEPTSEENLRKLPLLSISDIGKQAECFAWKEKYIEHTLFLETARVTRGVMYLRLNFNTQCLTEEELPYAGFLKTVLAYMDTKQHSFQDLSSDILLHTGGLSFDMNAYPDLRAYNHYTGIFSVETKLLYKDLTYVLSLMREILHTTKYEDTKRMAEILNEARSRERMKIEGAGHSYAVNRASAYFSGTARYQDLVGGVSYYRFICHIADAFRTEPKTLAAKLWEISDKLFRFENMFVSVTAEPEGIEALEQCYPAWKTQYLQDFREKELLREVLDTNYTAGAPETTDEAQPQLLLEGNRNEGFRTPSQVNYVARAGWYDPTRLPYTGALRVLKVILNYDYLWIHLRVKGGAYGCMAGFGRSGEGYLCSYRDPHLKETLDCYDALPDYLRHFTASPRDMTKYIIGAISELDTPRTNANVAALSVSAFLSHVSNEMLQQERDEVLQTTVEDIRALAAYAEALLATGASCTIGNAGKIDAHQELFLTTEELFQ